ncbi:hypothetical protein [Flagellimonas beolgyonensis]|uniref:hypothetical protein n=1 Tax=Flagellimonas beolgyonensis TaxID=864064 RepID=UPI000F8ED39E|nr:hypothetical protein [Allomuricauda beolgyonensis]
MIKTLKTIIYFSISLMLLVGCQEEPLNDLDQIENQDPNYSASKISLETLSSELKLDPHHDEIMSMFQGNQIDESGKKQKDTYILAKSNIVKITKKHGTSYTIQAIPENNSEGSLYNLVLFANPNGKLVRGHLLEYRPDNFDWLIDPLKPYQGSVQVVEQNFKNLDDILNTGNVTAKCEPVISEGWTCSFGYSHAPGECNASSFVYELNISSSCSGGGGTTTNNYSTTYVDESLDGGSGGTGGSGSGSGSSGGGEIGGNEPGFGDGGTTTTPTGDILVTFSPDNPINDMNDYLECFTTSQGATITVYVNEPNPGSGDTHVGSYVGHTFVSIQQGSNIATFGFYPVSDDIKPLFGTSSPSKMGDDGKDPYTVSISSTVTGAKLGNILNYAKNYQSSYDLNTYNCTDFAIGVGNKAGLNLPDAYGSWTFGGGSNPGTLGKYLLNRTSTSSQPINKNGGAAPETNKGC